MRQLPISNLILRLSVRKKILIVDDEEEILAFMARFLKRLEIDSITAISGEEAIELYKKNTFDCVLLDIHLGGMSGVEVLKNLKKMDPKVKAMIITGNICSDLKTDVHNLGVLDYIQKPIDLSDFKEKILTYINNQ
jgi:DNA-binding NtrC family response regulator